MTSVKSQRYGPRAHSTPDFSANITPAMCRALNGEVWGSCALAGGRSSLFEGVRVAGAYDLAPLDYDAVPLYRFAVEVGLEAAANAVGVALLRVQRRAGEVRSHRVVRHRPPRVVFRRGLGVPYVAGVPGQLALFERLDEGIPVDDRPARRVDHPGAPFHVEQPLAVEQPPRRRRQGSVDADNVAQRNELVDVRVADAQDVLVDGAELRNVVVEQPDVEVLEPHGRLLPDPAHADESDGFVFEVVGLPGDLADAPAALAHFFLTRYVVRPRGKDFQAAGSATLVMLLPVCSATVMFLLAASARSMLSDPMPARSMRRRFGAWSIISPVTYTGQKGVVIRTSASWSSW